jgi:flagellar basal body-associated protein FliL
MRIIERRTAGANLLCAAFVTRKEAPQEERKKRISMGTELLLTGLFIVLVLGLLVAFIYSMITFHDNARTSDASTEDNSMQIAHLLHIPQ